ncbi:energy coupling factor transporter S component ThiW [Roseburia sp. 499]|uniref:energy coupling factor transporter S component ThiW n=1 Tax=Roseburia sp. 499 TaxID=1261634 RepID=UPI000951A5E7|nr:energy coupling factor transporter S component ThiW [Roseburia sp. 499]WVK70362.1 energy coupling factor transporter S component ThiW [Roseburia sp. 499]
MKLNIKKLALAGMMTALGVALSAFSIPVGASKCFPVQHLLNVLAGVFLGPSYALGFSFSTALIRNLIGTGSLLAFPGSMVGAFCCALVYKYTKKIPLALLGEVVGTGILGGMLCYPVAKLLLGNAEAALFTYVLPFLISTLGGSLIAAVLLGILYKSKAIHYLNQMME